MLTPVNILRALKTHPNNLLPGSIPAEMLIPESSQSILLY